MNERYENEVRAEQKMEFNNELRAELHYKVTNFLKDHIVGKHLNAETLNISPDGRTWNAVANDYFWHEGSAAFAGQTVVFDSKCRIIDYESF